ncbi:spore cortex biosynthesis protein YabQ [Priestia endophytica]|uniref:spore cortex biosynthesis protein YabQ n=1 Tax=Priestia endophytica TaxID=135735 RepID=UPI000F526E21|nr:spore cortex biosynthesis protein YabQ [Priestia endophytica]RPJ99928.1 hypothetical protein FH5_03414 [Priestia endophytica]
MTLNVQFYTMVAMALTGSYLGAAIDTYRFFFNRQLVSRWIVFCHDIVFWLLQAVLIFYVLFVVNEGELRFYIFLALLCGFAAYQSLFKKPYQSLLTFLVRAVVSLYLFVVRLIQGLVVKPIWFIIQALIAIVLYVGNLLFTVTLTVLKIFLFPLAWLLRIIWRMLPTSVQQFCYRFFQSLKGFSVKIKNITIGLKQYLLFWKRKKEE